MDLSSWETVTLEFEMEGGYIHRVYGMRWPRPFAPAASGIYSVPEKPPAPPQTRLERIAAIQEELYGIGVGRAKGDVGVLRAELKHLKDMTDETYDRLHGPAEGTRK